MRVVLRKPFWLHRPVVNWEEIYRYAISAGATNIIDYKQLHVTLATVRTRADWSLFTPETDEIVIDLVDAPVEAFGTKGDVYALTFRDDRLTARFREIASLTAVDFADNFRAHITLGTGSTFVFPDRLFTGRLVLGPEKMEPFSQGVSSPSGIDINRNRYRTLVGLPEIDEEAEKVRERDIRKARLRD